MLWLKEKKVLQQMTRNVHVQSMQWTYLFHHLSGGTQYKFAAQKLQWEKTNCCMPASILIMYLIFQVKKVFIVNL